MLHCERATCHCILVFIVCSADSIVRVLHGSGGYRGMTQSWNEWGIRCWTNCMIYVLAVEAMCPWRVCHMFCPYGTSVTICLARWNQGEFGRRFLLSTCGWTGLDKIKPAELLKVSHGYSSFLGYSSCALGLPDGMGNRNLFTLTLVLPEEDAEAVAGTAAVAPAIIQGFQVEA